MASESDTQWSFTVNEQEYQWTSFKKSADTVDSKQSGDYSVGGRKANQKSSKEKTYFSLEKKYNFKQNTAYDWSPLPRILLTNARSINNKRDYLSDLIEADEDIKKCDIILITETWLKDGSDDIDVPNFNIVLRADRDKEKTGKSRGGGLCALMKDMTARKQELDSNKNYELMTFFCHSDDHPTDIPPLIFILAYIPRPDFKDAKQKITESYNKVQQWSNGGPIFLLGDFNSSEFSDLKVSLRKNARSVEQYVTCPTRGEKTLDKCYGNIKTPYKSKCKPPLRSRYNNSDHNIIILTQEECNPTTCNHTETKAFWESRMKREEKKKEKEAENVEELSQKVHKMSLAGGKKKGK